MVTTASGIGAPVAPADVIAAARQIAQRSFPGVNLHAGCLMLAWAAIAASRRAGLSNWKLYAGSATWPCQDPAHDDGINPSHFGYCWDLSDPVSALRLVQGLMPEMHVWAGFGLSPVQHDKDGAYIGPETIVDLTTRSWPVQCRRILGRPWQAPMPPDYLWARYDQLPEGVSYRPYREAGALAQQLLGDLATKQDVTP